ncbi:YiiX/YebB-like N1pC/P60 family cysteine hydrolase [Kingella potus]|uniref:YiiX/YebB-like N1pC/P60 family cysteine hydrolase n=1 Tax=Kingella potus TaxID=265175 RepID=UPI001559F9A4|nr:YiiX/YebB-like N1pC/P60 family cysteine hydrolase [Kingella potus]UOP01098.1 hypothetical protein LVJ84_01735 [Kingella potus]
MPRAPNQVLLTPLPEFFASDKAENVLIPHPRFLNAAQRRSSADYAQKQLGRAFNLTARTATPFYCTTLIAEALNKQGAAFEPQRQYLDVAVFRGGYLFPQVFLSADTQQVYRYEAR